MIKKKNVTSVTKKELVTVHQLPCPDSVWVRDVDKDLGEHYLLAPVTFEFVCKCGFKTMDNEEILRHLKEKHQVKNPDSEILFQCYRREDLPKDARIMSWDEWKEKQRRDLDIPYIR